MLQPYCLSYSFRCQHNISLHHIFFQTLLKDHLMNVHSCALAMLSSRTIEKICLVEQLMFVAFKSCSLIYFKMLHFLTNLHFLKAEYDFKTLHHFWIFLKAQYNHLEILTFFSELQNLLRFKGWFFCWYLVSCFRYKKILFILFILNTNYFL